MSNFKYLKVSKFKKLRYLSINQNSNLYVVFLPGFMSDIEGNKPKNFLKFCKKRKLGFLAIEYSGHGKSSGKFTNGNISKWTNEVIIGIKKIIKKNNFILIGSSMGAWLSIIQFKYFKRQIKGLIGIGSAPEFLSRLMWNKFPKKIKREIINKGVTEIKNGGYTYLISKQLIDDGKKNKVFKKRINSKINVTMFHGSKDEVVPVNFSRKVLKIFTKAKKKIVIIKKGNHSLSSRNSIKKILKELDRFKILNL